MISAIILTNNSEKTINCCINSLLWVDQIIVVDDNSTDKTIEIINKIISENKRVNVHLNIFSRHLDSFSAQRNFGLDKAVNKWVLFVDSDEEINANLQQEILHIISNSTEVCGFYFRRNDYFLGKQLKYGETAGIKLLRLALKTKGKWTGDVHETWNISGNLKLLNNPINHYPHKSISDFLIKINKYSRIRAHELYREGIKTNIFEILFKPSGKFILNYFIRLGFMDGMQGLIMAIIMSFHSFLVRSKLYLIK